MTLPKFITLGILAALGAHGKDQTPPTFEEIKRFAGLRVAIHTTDGGAYQGVLTEVRSDEVVLKSFNAIDHSVPIREIESIDKPGFRGSRMDLTLRKTGHAVAMAPVRTLKAAGLFTFVIWAALNGGGNLGPS